MRVGGGFLRDGRCRACRAIGGYRKPSGFIRNKKNKRSQQDLIRHVSNGAHLNLAAGSRTQQDLVQLAALAKKHDTKITLRQVGQKQTDDLVQLAAIAVFDD
jgi:hypothetical protein